MTLSSLVCRTCLGIISESKKGYCIEDENGLIRNVRNIREMIIFCFPEMDTYISLRPSICDTCLSLLISLYNFKIRCMKVENVIRNYIQTNNIMEGTCVNLNNVVRVQILEALKQKNWPPDLIKEYIAKVNTCLEKASMVTCLNNTGTANQLDPPVPPQILSDDVCIDITDSSDEMADITSASEQRVSQENYLSTLNLINCNTLREEVSLVESAREMYNSSPRTRHFVKSVGSKLRQIRKPMPKSRKNEINANNSRDSQEVLIMNFCETENLLSNTDSNLKEAYISDTPDRPSSNLSNKRISNSIKRKLTPKETITEILSKRRKLVVEVNPNLRYLHKNKSLVVVLERSAYLECPFCKFTTLSNSALKLHHDRMHKTCRLCNYKCSTKPVLDKHLKQEHSDEVMSIIELYNEDKANFLCYYCKYVGLSKYDLRDHRFSSHLKFDRDGYYTCPSPGCNMKDFNSYFVIVHMETRHDNVKKRECPLCNHCTAGGPYDAKQHVLTHSLVRADCSFCGMRYRSHFLLKKHMEKEHALPIHQQKAGMVYDFTADDRNLTTNEEGVVTLGQPHVQPEVTNCDDTEGDDVYGWKKPSLVEMLCSSSLLVSPEQDDDCVIVDDDAVVASNSEKTQPEAASSVNDLTFHDWILQNLPTNEPRRQATEVITINDDEDDEVIMLENVCHKSSEDDVTKPTDSAVKSRRVISLQEVSLDKSTEIERNVVLEGQPESSVESREVTSSEELSDKTLSKQKPEEQTAAESREVTSSQEPVQDPKESEVPPTTEEIPIEKQQDSSVDNADDQPPSGTAAEVREVTSSQKPLEDPKLDSETSLSNEEPVETLEDKSPIVDNSDDLNPSETSAEAREVSSSQERLQDRKESPNLSNSEHPSEILNEDQTPTENNSDDLHPSETVAESKEVSSSRERDGIVEAEIEVPSDDETDDSQKIEKTSAVPSSFKRSDAEELNKSSKEIEDSLSVQLQEPIRALEELALLHQDETVSEDVIMVEQPQPQLEKHKDVELRENSCEVSSSNLLDEISLQGEGSEKSLLGVSEVTSSANLN